MDHHLDPDTLAAYVDGRLAITELDSADRHIDACGSCRSELSALAAAHTLPAPASVDRDVPEGRLGRYHVLRELGRGSMGVVLRAYDPELARPVAIKLLRDVTRDELRDEARTLAKLRHPNVITVYDVFRDEHGMYLAMELVDGDTLRGFAKGRSHAQVLDACIRAGRGLAAAHDAGVIHRDFKPENVLCGDDGEVRVSDFGLAKESGAAADGAIAGTPLYMAPEVLQREPATAASDQYSFCVAVHEMLTGSRPGGAGAAATGPALPSWVARALRRGLAKEPANRFPSMHELVAALADDPRVRRRRRLLLAGVAVAALATGALAVKLASSSAQVCPLDDHALAQAWNGEHGKAITAAFAKLGLSADKVIGALDAYRDAWLEVRHEACASRHERGGQSRVVLSRRMTCLDRGRRQFGELVQQLEGADAKLAAGALEAIWELRDPITCAGGDVDAVPENPASRVIVEEARTLLDRAIALQFAGKLDKADVIAEQVVRIAEPHDVPALVAEALLVQARVSIDRDKQDVAEERLYKALHAAERAREDRLVAEIWIELVMTTGAQKHRFELGLANAKAAEAAVARVDSLDLHVRYDYSIGSLLLAQGKVDEARPHLERALKAASDDPRRVGQRGLLQATLCDVERQANKLPAAHAYCTKALATLEETFGPDHMRVALTLNVLGGVAFAEKDWATAETTYKRVIELLERRNLRTQINYALALSNLGAVYSMRDQLAPSREYFERALAAFNENHPKHPQRLLPLQGLASLALRSGDTKAAVERYGQVRDALAATYAPEHPGLLVAHYNYALALVSNKQPDKAQPVVDELIAHSLTPKQESWVLASRGLDLSAQLADQRKQHAAALALTSRALAAISHTDDLVERALVERHIGEIHRHMKQPAQAVPVLEEAIKHFGTDADGYDIGSTRYHLALALWESGKDKARSLEVAKQALADLAKAESGEGRKQYQDTLTAFVKQHAK